MMRAVGVVALVFGLAGMAGAQDTRTQTLADIRQELSVLFVEIQRVRAEMNTTGASGTPAFSPDTFTRVEELEGEVARLNALTETLQLRLTQIAEDGANRINDLEFRLCELEPDCDLAQLERGTTLGQDVGTDAGTGETTLPPVTPDTGAGTGSVAIGERGDFQAAQAAYDSGDFAAAAAAFEQFVTTYPASPQVVEALFFRGEAESAQGNWRPAARAYLDAFSGAPTGPLAAQSLLRLGVSLNELGQIAEACLTLDEVTSRFPGSPQALEAQTARVSFGCP